MSHISGSYVRICSWTTYNEVQGYGSQGPHYMGATLDSAKNKLKFNLGFH